MHEGARNKNKLEMTENHKIESRRGVSNFPPEQQWCSQLSHSLRHAKAANGAMGSHGAGCALSSQIVKYSA
jgi:hypothetical protein